MACQDNRPACIVSLSMNPLKQGLKLPTIEATGGRVCLFIHESIKTRIETPYHRWGNLYQRLFIHESIKTRIETYGLPGQPAGLHSSLSMNPLKQGLKRAGKGYSQAFQKTLYP